MSPLLAEHDRLVVAGRRPRRVAKYGEAIKVLDQAKAQIAAARTLRDQLAKRSTSRSSTSGSPATRTTTSRCGTSTRRSRRSARRSPAATRAAVKAEAAARAQLPPDTRGLVVIMADIGQGGMSGAVIAIEEARAKLADALDSGATSASPEPEPEHRSLTGLARGYTGSPTQRSPSA